MSVDAGLHTNLGTSDLIILVSISEVRNDLSKTSDIRCKLAITLDWKEMEDHINVNQFRNIANKYTQVFF